MPPDLKTRGGSILFPKDFRSAAKTKNPNLGIKNSVMALRRDGELEEIIAIVITDASPSTIHVSHINV